MAVDEAVVAVFDDHLRAEAAVKELADGGFDMKKADGFLVMAHGTAQEMTRARAILHAADPTRLDLHRGLQPPAPPEQAANAAE